MDQGALAYMICTVFTTAPRPKPTLAASLASFMIAGFEAPLVISDGMCPPIAASLQINDPPLGCLNNWAYALRVLCGAGAPWCMIAQDDTTWALGGAASFKEQLRSLETSRKFDKLGMISLYCPVKVSHFLERHKQERLTPGFHKSHMGWETWGAQAFAFPLHAARLLHQDPQFMNYVATYVKNKNVDRIVPKCLVDMGLDVLYRIPCLVNHEMGSANSSLADKPVQRALLTRYWTGQA